MSYLYAIEPQALSESLFLVPDSNLRLVLTCRTSSHHRGPPSLSTCSMESSLGHTALPNTFSAMTCLGMRGEKTVSDCLSTTHACCLVVYVACITTLPLIRAVARVRPGWTACTLLFFCCCCCCRHLSNSQQGYCCDFVMPKRRGPGSLFGLERTGCRTFFLCDFITFCKPCFSGKGFFCETRVLQTMRWGFMG